MLEGMRFTQGRFSFLLLLSVLTLFGCVRVEANKDEPKPTQLIVTRDMHGVRLQFKSVRNLHYTIYYRDAGVPNDDWKQLPNATQLAGTGELILLSDPSPRAFQFRKYRINSLIPVSRKELKKMEATPGR